MSQEDPTIECSVHGRREATFICQHLVGEAEGLGFNVADDPEAIYPDAWCDECEAVWEREGDWTETTEATLGVTAVCSGCYASSRARNWKQDDEAWAQLVQSSCVWLSEKQQAFVNEFRMGEHGRWDRDQETGVLVFSTDGTPRVEADFQFVGSLSLPSETWMWAWANPSFEEKVTSASRTVRDLGRQRSFLPLFADLIDADEHDAGHFTAIMAKHLDAIGSYRTADDNRYLYMVITKARWL